VTRTARRWQPSRIALDALQAAGVAPEQVVARLADPDHLVEVEVKAYVGS
jgi:hypothetical protein